MPGGDLDDFELERTPQTPRDDTPGRTAAADAVVTTSETEPALVPAPDGGARLFPLTLIALALIAFGVLVLLFVVFRQPSATRPAAATATPGPVAAPAQAPPTSAPTPSLGPLPPLEESDDYVRRVAAALSSHPELARWLGETALVRTLTAVVTNVADGETPRPHLGFLAPRQRFRAAPGPGRRVVPDPAGFAGYDRFADAIASIDASAAVAAYRSIEPLFDAAYRELGHPDGRFRHGLDQALAALVGSPVPPPDAELVPHAIGFRYADPKLESLTAAQKQFLRTGPRNVAIIQAKLREVQAALRSADAPPAERSR